MSLTAPEREEIVQVYADAQREGFTLRQAVEFFRSNREAAQCTVRVGEAYTKFLKEKKAARLSRRSLASLRSNVGRFIAGREGLLLRVVSREDVLSWLARDEWGPRTFNSYLISLKTFFNWCVNLGYILKSPTAAIQLIDESRMPDLDVPPVVLSVAQSEALLRATLERDRGLVPYIATGLFAGLRPNREAAGLLETDIFDGFIRVRGLHAKDRQRRDVEIHPTLQAWLDLGGEFRPKNLRRRLERIRAAAGLIRLEKVPGKERKQIVATGWAQDCLRHTFASLLCQS